MKSWIGLIVLFCGLSATSSCTFLAPETICGLPKKFQETADERSTGSLACLRRATHRFHGLAFANSFTGMPISRAIFRSSGGAMSLPL